jgi:hypothetical protein
MVDCSLIVSAIRQLGLAILFFFMVEWASRKADQPLASFGIRWYVFIFWSFNCAIIIATTVLFSAEENSFIYFQF